MGKSQLFNQWEGGYPDCADAITAMIGFESNSEDRGFIPPDEEQQNWQEIILQYFQRRGLRTGFSNIVSGAIETLKLGA